MFSSLGATRTRPTSSYYNKIFGKPREVGNQTGALARPCQYPLSERRRRTSFTFYDTYTRDQYLTLR